MIKSPLKVIVLILFLAFAYRECHAEYVDLKGGIMQEQGICRHSDQKVYRCVAIVKDGKVYNLLYDEKGEVAIYLMENGKSSLLWSKSSI